MISRLRLVRKNQNLKNEEGLLDGLPTPLKYAAVGALSILGIRDKLIDIRTKVEASITMPLIMFGLPLSIASFGSADSIDTFVRSTGSPEALRIFFSLFDNTR